MTRPELLTALRAGRAELETALAKIPLADWEAERLPGGWSLKDVVGVGTPTYPHLGWWERRVVTMYATLGRGETPGEKIGEGQFDAVNARIYAENRARPLDEVRRDEAQAYADLLALAETAPEADLLDPARFEWLEGRKFAGRIAANTFGHYADHLPDLIALAA